MNEEKKKEAKERMLIAIPYILLAIEEAKKNGEVKLGILSVRPDGGGKIEARFDTGSFFEDLALILDVPEISESDRTKFKIQSLFGSLKN